MITWENKAYKAIIRISWTYANVNLTGRETSNKKTLKIDTISCKCVIPTKIILKLNFRIFTSSSSFSSVASAYNLFMTSYIFFTMDLPCIPWRIILCGCNELFALAIPILAFYPIISWCLSRSNYYYFFLI